MTPQESERYQAGRCDAHGNRMITKDEWYLRGWFAAFLNLDGVNPYDPTTYDKSQSALERINYNRVVLHIERRVRSFLEHEREFDMIEAFDEAGRVI